MDSEFSTRWRELADAAFKDRLSAARSGYLPRLEDALSDARSVLDAGWTSRFLSEIAHYRWRIEARRQRGTAAERCLAESVEAFSLATEVGDPFLCGLAAKELNRWSGAGESEEQLARLLTCFENLAVMIGQGEQSVYGRQITRVARLLAGSAGQRLRAPEQRDEQLELFRRARKLPGMSSLSICDLYRLELVALKTLRRIDDRHRLLDEFLGRNDLGNDGASLAKRLAATDANESQAWRLAARLSEEAALLARSAGLRGDRWNKAAYNHIRAGMLDEADRCLDQADAAWKEMKVAPVGASITRRNRARVVAQRGDEVGALRLLIRNIEISQERGSEKYPMAILALLESIASANDATLASLPGMQIRTLDGPVGLDQCETIAQFGLSMVKTSKLAALRMMVALANIILRNGGPPPPWLILELQNQLANSEVRSAWRLGRANFALARLLLLQGGATGAAAAAAFDGFNQYEKCRGAAASLSGDGEDVAWLIRSEYADYLLAWELSIKTSDHARAAAIAEGARGTVLTRIIRGLADADGDMAADVAKDNLNARVDAADDAETEAEETAEADDEDDDDDSSNQESAGRGIFRRAGRIERKHRSAILRAASDLLTRLEFTEDDIEPLVVDLPTIYCDLDASGRILVTWLLPSGEAGSEAGQLSETATRASTQLGSFDSATSANATKRVNPDVDDLMNELGSILVNRELHTALTTAGHQRLRFVPSRMMWSVPFAALFVGSERLVEQWSFSLAPSLNDANMLNRREQTASTSVSAYLRGGLAGVDRERTAIRRFFPSSLVFGSPSKFVKHLSDGGRRRDYMVAMALHGEDHESNGDQILKLGRGVALGTWDLFGLYFGQVTVAGGCWLARVHEESGFGPLGLAFPVLAKGALHLVAGLYEIESGESGEILSYFYEAVSDGVIAPEALRQAQRRWLRDNGSNRPLYEWAGLTCIGA
jgi:hypothetical protein